MSIHLWLEMEVVAGGANVVVKKGAGTGDVSGKLVLGGAEDVSGKLVLGGAEDVSGKLVLGGAEDVSGKLVPGGAVLGSLLLETGVTGTVVGRFAVATSDDDSS
jgi:hypothetical protein